MATLALEIGLLGVDVRDGESDDGYDVRIFTPDAELPFAGHPTLGTAFVLASRGRIGADVVQVSAAGEVPVRVDLAPGARRCGSCRRCSGAEVTDRAAVADAAGLTRPTLSPISRSSSRRPGSPHLMVPVQDEAALRRAVRRDRTADVCAAAEAESLYLFTVRGDGDVMARMFDRGSVIGEDPATGSAAGPLGAYLAVHGLAGMPGRVVVAQGEMVRRPSFLHVDVEPAGDSWAIDVRAAFVGWARASSGCS